MIDDVIIKRVPLPGTVNGATLYKDDYILIIINDNKSIDVQNMALKHELEHIKRGHLYTRLKCASECESEIS